MPWIWFRGRPTTAGESCARIGSAVSESCRHPDTIPVTVSRRRLNVRRVSISWPLVNGHENLLGRCFWDRPKRLANAAVERKPAIKILALGFSLKMMAKKGRRVFYGWIIVAASGGIEFANAASAIAILTIFVNPMTAEFGWSRTQISGATSLGAVLGASLAPFTGWLVDRIGSRALLTLGGVVVALACLYLASVQTLVGFYVAFTFARIADQGLIKIGAAPGVGKWFQRYRGRAIALVFFAGSAGIVVLAPLVQLVIEIWGWRAAWLLLSGVMLALGVLPCALFIRRRPEDQGLLMDGAPGPEPNADEAPSLSGSYQDSREEEPQWPMRQVVRTPTFWLVLASLFVVSSASSGVNLHLVPHLREQGLGPGAAVTVIILLNSFSAAGILVLGFLAERLPPQPLMAAMCLLVAAGIGVLLTADTLAEAYLFAMIHGVATGGLNTLAPILWASYYGRGTLGSLHGVSRASQVAGFALGPLVLGIAYDAWGSYQTVLVYLAFTAVASFFLVLGARRPKVVEQW